MGQLFCDSRQLSQRDVRKLQTRRHELLEVRRHVRYPRAQLPEGAGQVEGRGRQQDAHSRHEVGGWQATEARGHREKRSSSSRELRLVCMRWRGDELDAYL